MAREGTLSLTLEFQGKEGTTKIEVHTLNPGTQDHIERFGGSKHAIFAKKTASIVTRTEADGMRTDLEVDILRQKLLGVDRSPHQWRDRSQGQSDRLIPSLFSRDPGAHRPGF